MRILLDIDGVVADLVGALCLGLHRTPEDFREYSFEDCGFSPWELSYMRRCMNLPGYCAALPQYKGARGFVERLHELGDVVAVTKPFATGKTWAHERESWCRELGISKVVHTGYKELVKGDLLVEDHIANISSWLAEWPKGRAILIERPWNRNKPVDVRRTDFASSFAHALDQVCE